MTNDTDLSQVKSNKEGTNNEDNEEKGPGKIRFKVTDYSRGSKSRIMFHPKHSSMNFHYHSWLPYLELILPHNYLQGLRLVCFIH